MVTFYIVIALSCLQRLLSSCAARLQSRRRFSRRVLMQLVPPPPPLPPLPPSVTAAVSTYGLWVRVRGPGTVVASDEPSRYKVALIMWALGEVLPNFRLSS